jgi:hypothetical protein
MKRRLAAALIAACLAPATVQAQGYGCGCQVPAAASGAYCCPQAQPVVVCRKHCKHHGHMGHHYAAAPPVGPVVASVAAPQFATMSAINLVAAPTVQMVSAVQPTSIVQMAPQSYVPQAAPQATCQASGPALLELEERVNLLQRRLDRVQMNVEEQTEILRAIAQKLGTAPASAPVPVPELTPSPLPQK